MTKHARRKSALILGPLVLILASTVTFYSSRATACGLLDFECLYNQLKLAYEELEGKYINFRDVVVPDLQSQLTDLTQQITAPVNIANDLSKVVEQQDLALLGLDTKMLGRLDEALRFLHDQNDALLDDFEAFAGDRTCDGICAEFRGQLGGLFRSLANLTNTSNEVLSLQATLTSPYPLEPVVLRINGDGLAGFIDQAPPALLFPLYYALNSAPDPNPNAPAAAHPASFSADGSVCSAPYCRFFNPLTSLIADLNARVEELRVMLEDLRTRVENRPRDLVCTGLFADPQVPDYVSSISTGIAIGARVLYEAGNFLAEPKISLVEGEDSAGGEFGVGVNFTVERRPAAQLGVVMRMVTNPLRLLAEGVGETTSDCRQRLEQYLAICALANDVKKNSTFASCKDKVLYTSERFGF